jgi:hypothetical protein
MGEVREGATLRHRSRAVTSTWWIWEDLKWDLLFMLVLTGVTIPLAPLAARGNDIRRTTDFGSGGGEATARRLLAVADECGRVPKR